MAASLVRKVKLTKEEIAAYDAPFPSSKYKTAVWAMPQPIPSNPKSIETLRNREAWKLLALFIKPFRTAFSDNDDASRILPVDKNFQNHVKGAIGQKHVKILNAGHFLQEDQSEAVAQELISFIKENPK